MKLVLKYLTSTSISSEINLNHSHLSVFNKWKTVFQWNVKCSSDSSPEFSGITKKETQVWLEQRIRSQRETPVRKFSLQLLPLPNPHLCNKSLISTTVGSCSQTLLSSTPKSLAPRSPTFQHVLFVLSEGELLSARSRSPLSLQFSFCSSLMSLDSLRTAAFNAFRCFWVSPPSVLGNRVKTRKWTWKQTTKKQH